MTELIPRQDSNRPVGVGSKHPKGYAGGITQMFAHSAEHYAWLAYNYQKPVVTIDLLTLRIEPPEFDIERNRILAEHCRHTLLRNLKTLAPPGSVIAAVLRASFGIDGYQVAGRHTTLGESIFTVILTDDRGKEWRGEHREERMLVAD